MPSDFCLLICKARILLPAGEWFRGDVLTRSDEIVQVAPEILDSEVAKVDREIDADGLTLLPGVIDPQVHFR
jgi:dihydroorotase